MSRYRIRPTAELMDPPDWIAIGDVFEGAVDLLGGSMFNRRIVLEQPKGAGRFAVPERELEKIG
jgi:hypothetical protein